MSLSRQRITLVTLGVADMDRARAFYEAWGWSPHTGSQPGVTFYQMNGAVLALFGLADLAADQGRPGAGLGTGAVTLAQNCPDDKETDTVFQAAIDAGATVLKQPEKVFWGGYSGYFADPDGHVWEIATNPFWPLAPDGSLTLPDA
jgi:catechol 2,3-dioxygenase-like lactoylglutathione lyase family enzyme